MGNKELSLRLNIAIGWIMMFFVLLAMFVVDLAKSAINENFENWSQDMNEGGLMIMLVIMCIYIFIPMLTLVINAKWYRGFVIGITAFITLFFIAHEIAHMLTGDMPFGLRHILDFSHHILGVWVTIAAVKWSKIPAAYQASVADQGLLKEA
jgi:hypothetical protein